MDFKTRTTLILEDKSEFTYTIKFKILKPEKCYVMILDPDIRSTIFYPDIYKYYILNII